MKRLCFCFGEIEENIKLGCGLAEEGCIEGANREISAAGVGVSVIRAPKVAAAILDRISERTVYVDAGCVIFLCGRGEVIVEDLTLIEIIVAAKDFSVGRSYVEIEFRTAFVNGFSDLFDRLKLFARSASVMSELPFS